MNNDNKTTTISSAQFRDGIKKLNEGQIITLTETGITVRVGRPNISQMLADGKIPQNLTAIALDIQKGGAGSITTQQAKDSIEYLNYMVHQAILEPNDLTIEDVAMLPDEDKGEIMSFVQGGTRSLEKFRKQRSGSDAGSDLPEVSGQKA